MSRLFRGHDRNVADILADKHPQATLHAPAGCRVKPGPPNYQGFSGVMTATRGSSQKKMESHVSGRVGSDRVGSVQEVFKLLRVGWSHPYSPRLDLTLPWRFDPTSEQPCKYHTLDNYYFNSLLCLQLIQLIGFVLTNCFWRQSIN